MKIFQTNENSFIVELENIISPEINEKIIHLKNELEKKDYIINTFNAYNSLYAEFDIIKTNFGNIKNIVEKYLINFNYKKLKNRIIYNVPVCYEPNFAIDIDFVAKYNNLNINDVIKLHTEPLYKIYFLGFTPGFPYLGGLNDKINAPRLETPRKKIEKGSVGIAGNQTGIYSVNSPGGWRLIGKTPINLFNKSSKKPSIFEAGNFIKFYSISLSEYDYIKHNVEKGTYDLKIEMINL